MKHYKVECSKRGKIFATLEEAIACENEIRKATGIFVAIVETDEAVTHVYELDKQEENTHNNKGEENMFTTYTEAVTSDALEYIKNNYTTEEITEAMNDRDEFEEKLNDEMWIADDVTGNGSGSYTFNREQAKEYVLSDPETVLDAVREFCCGMDAAELMQKLFNGDWEYFDVTTRCYVLGQAIDAALDKIEKGGLFHE